MYVYELSEIVICTIQHIQLAVQHNNKEPPSMAWDKLPLAVDPSEGTNSYAILMNCLKDMCCYYIGHLPLDRAQRKRQQIENMANHVHHLISGGGDVIVDFCAGAVSVSKLLLWS